MKLLNLGPGDFPDVCWHGGLCYVAWHAGAAVMVRSYNVATEVTSERVIQTSGVDFSPFPRLAVLDGGLYLAYRDAAPRFTAQLVHVAGPASYGVGLAFGRCDGNHPVALGGQMIAWQVAVHDGDGWAFTIETCQLPTGEIASYGLGAPTGLNRIAGTLVITRDEERVPFGTWPHGDARAMAAEHVDGGVVVSITGKWLYLWPGQETREPSCASDDTHVAVAAWGRLGVQVAIGELSEAQPDSRFDPPPPPPSIPAPTVTLSLDRTSGVAPCTVLATVSLTHADTWRWLLNGVIHKPDDGASHLFVLPAGTYTIAVRAGGTGGQTTSVPIAVTVTAPPIPDPPPVPEPPPVPPPVPLPAFLAGVQTGFGARLVRPDDNVFAQLRRRGWWMARVGVSLTDPAETAAIIAEVTDAGLVPLVIARPQDVLTLPWIRGLRVELGNEPDIGSPPSTPRMSPAAYVAWVEPALEAAKARRYALYTGGISNITPVAVGWLCSVLPYLPPWIGVCYHRYKQSPGDTAKTPRNGYASRAAEFAALKAVTGSRPLICSEFGWGTGAYRQRVWWFWTRTRRLTEQDVLTRTRDELALLASQQIDAGIVYQIGDGPPGIERDYFGIRRFDGTWKPVADVLL